MKNHHGHVIVWSALAVLLLKGVVAWISSERTNTFSFHAFAVLRSDFEHSLKMTLDDAILNRYACKRFRRYSNTSSVDMVDGAVHRASSSDPSVVQRALQCLDLARRTPTAFNTQPYKVVLVHTPEQKEKLSKFCLGPNGARVRDSDCTAVFLADKQVTRTFPRFRQLLQRIGETKSRRPLKRLALLKMQFYITLFSSGLPMHRCLAAPISFLVRTGMSLVNLFTKWFYPMPTLASAETWSSKQVMMVAMTFMLACTSRGLVTIPMEGMPSAELSFAFHFTFKIFSVFISFCIRRN